MNATFLTRKPTNNGHLYQINGCGSWRSEYNTDSLLANGTYPVLENGRKVGEWNQTTFGHEVK